MVALSTSLACRSFELDGIATSAEETYEHGQSAKLLQGNETQWAGSRESISPSGRGGAFFLTSLFIELIDSWRTPHLAEVVKASILVRETESDHIRRFLVLRVA